MPGVRSVELTVASQFISPFWLSSLPREESSVVAADGSIGLRGQSMIARGPSPFRTGESVIIRIAGRRITAYSAAALTVYEAQQALARKAEAEQAAARQAAADHSAVEANKALNIPANWRPEIKVVLSGLSENSRQDGANSRTVMHVRLLEPLADGKLTRRAGDYLCTAPGGSNGSWSELADAWDDLPPHRTSPVTCRACLKIARRWAAS